jgi:hypothetical protein
MTTAAPPINGSLRGQAPSTFTGDRTKTAEFARELKRQFKLNPDHEMMKKPYFQVLNALSYIKGPAVNLWVDAVEQAMEEQIADVNTAVNRDSESLWTDFLTILNKDWTDSLTKEKAYQKLTTLKMETGGLDVYILEFERLAHTAGWDRSAPGTVEFFKRGLTNGLYRACLQRDAIPDTMDEWQKTARLEAQRYKLIVAGPGLRKLGPTQTTGPSRPKNTRDPNAMDVDATTSNPSRFPFKKLTDDEKKQYMKEGRCFRCRQQGHMARECTRSAGTSSSTARTTETEKAKEPQPDAAPPYTQTTTISSISTASSSKTTSKVEDALALIKSMSKEERNRYYLLDPDFSDAEL